VITHVRISIPLDNTGDYVMFPSSMFHRGYYNQTCDMTIITAQFFCVAKASDDDFRVSRTVMNASRVVQLEHFAHAELLDNLCADLLFHWDEKFPLAQYPPPKKYNLSPVDTATNRLVKKGQLSNVSSLKEIANVFEGIYTNVEVNSVWFIQKEKGGDGFQDWHKDDIDYSQAESTIVLNVCSEQRSKSSDEVTKSSFLANTDNLSSSSSLLSSKDFSNYSIADLDNRRDLAKAREFYRRCETSLSELADK